VKVVGRATYSYEHWDAGRPLYASMVALRRGLRSIGVSSPAVIALWDPSADSRALKLTANTETPYGMTFLDLKAWGPTVIESPPGSLCVVDDFWQRYVTDMGIAGPDQGQGGKYLYLPPGYDGEVSLQANPDGSHDLYFGPAAPDGHDANWVQTIPGKSWFVIFRLFGPLQPWFDQTWTLNEFEPID
jgi:hypothetical protein